ncbi:MAG: hypothetical protein ACU837_00335 [Gammaproteobacteria bacterium]
MGDCKDHATLLQALIISGNIYRLPKIPVASMVNHVLNYLPSLDMYADATTETTPYGAQDKPVLLVDGFREGTNTSPSSPASNRQDMSKMRCKTPGNVCSAAAVKAYDKFAAKVRQNLKEQVVYK